MRELGSRRGASNLAVPLMIASFVLMAAFLYWLSRTAEPTSAIPTDRTEQPDSMDEMETASLLVEKDSLRLRPDDFVGQRIRLADVNVPSGVGERAFFVELGTSQQSTPFLVKIDTAMVARGVGVPLGERVTVTGTVHAMSDSVLTAWIDTGVITEAERPIAEFATHFIEAARIRTPRGLEGGESAPDSASDDDGGA